MQGLLVDKRELSEQFKFTDTDTRMVQPRPRLSPTAITAIHLLSGAFSSDGLWFVPQVRARNNLPSAADPPVDLRLDRRAPG